jgi:hypothetical protein
MLKTFKNILDELGWPNIYLISSEQFEHIDGDKMRGLYGIASDHEPVISINTGLRGRVLRNTLYHEIAHHLFPHRPHWWIECFAEKMAGGGGRGYYSNLTGHTPDELPTRTSLLAVARRASKRFNELRS